MKQIDPVVKRHSAEFPENSDEIEIHINGGASAGGAHIFIDVPFGHSADDVRVRIRTNDKLYEFNE